MGPDAIREWPAEFRMGSNGPFQMNLWIPDPSPVRDQAAELRQRSFLRNWGPEVPTDAGEAVLPDFEAQCYAMIECRPTAISSIMGVFAISQQY
jgi:nitronate monooxygenase